MIKYKYDHKNHKQNTLIWASHKHFFPNTSDTLSLLVCVSCFKLGYDTTLWQSCLMRRQDRVFIFLWLNWCIFWYGDQHFVGLSEGKQNSLISRLFTLEPRIAYRFASPTNTSFRVTAQWLLRFWNIWEQPISEVVIFSNYLQFKANW